jgi:hypothetical protein
MGDSGPENTPPGHNLYQPRISESAQPIRHGTTRNVIFSGELRDGRHLVTRLPFPGLDPGPQRSLEAGCGQLRPPWGWWWWHSPMISGGA